MEIYLQWVGRHKYVKLALQVAEGLLVAVLSSLVHEVLVLFFSFALFKKEHSSDSEIVLNFFPEK